MNDKVHLKEKDRMMGWGGARKTLRKFGRDFELHASRCISVLVDHSDERHTIIATKKMRCRFQLDVSFLFSRSFL